MRFGIPNWLGLSSMCNFDSLKISPIQQSLTQLFEGRGFSKLLLQSLSLDKVEQQISKSVAFDTTLPLHQTQHNMNLEGTSGTCLQHSFLQWKIYLPMQILDLTKTQVAKYTDSEAMEFETVRTATERTREILESIDKQVIS